MSLLSAIANRKSLRRTEALKRYAAIVWKNDDNDAEELLEVMDQLGKTSDDVAADLRIIVVYEANRASFETRHEKKKASEAAQAVAQKAKTDLAIFKSEGGYDPARDIANNKIQYQSALADAQHTAAINAGYEMRKIAKEDPDLFINKAL
jgi:hypothetical protein